MKIQSSLQMLIEAQKNLKKKFYYASHKQITVITEIQKDIKKLKASGGNPYFIKAKENLVEDLVDFYNITESIINQYDTSLLFANINNRILENFIIEANEDILGSDENIQAMIERTIHQPGEDDYYPFQEKLEKEVVSTPVLPDQLFEQLPKPIKRPCLQFNMKRERDLFLTSALGVISGCMPGYHFIHDRKRYFMNLFTFISAPSASGKSKMSYSKMLAGSIDQMLRQENRMKKELYESQLNEYNYSDPKERQYKQKPEEPDYKYLFIPANSSSSAMIQLLQRNEGSGIIFENEADTLANTIMKEWADYSDNLRKAFEHEDILQNRKGNDNYILIKNPCISTILSGTPKQLINLMKSPENGLFSRFIYYSFEIKPVWKRIFSVDSQSSLDAYFSNLSTEYLRIYEYFLNKPVQFKWNSDEFNCGQYLDNVFDEWVKRYTHIINKDVSSIIFRLGVTITRIAAILSFLQYWEDANYSRIIYGSKQVLDISLMLVEVYLHHSLIIYSLLPDGEECLLDGNQSLFYSRLPDEFKREDISYIKEELNISERTVTRYLKEMVVKGLLKNNSYARYSKIKIVETDKK